MLAKNVPQKIEQLRYYKFHRNKRLFFQNNSIEGRKNWYNWKQSVRTQTEIKNLHQQTAAICSYVVSKKNVKTNIFVQKNIHCSHLSINFARSKSWIKNKLKKIQNKHYQRKQVKFHFFDRKKRKRLVLSVPSGQQTECLVALCSETN